MIVSGIMRWKFQKLKLLVIFDYRYLTSEYCWHVPNIVNYRIVKLNLIVSLCLLLRKFQEDNTQMRSLLEIEMQLQLERDTQA